MSDFGGYNVVNTRKKHSCVACCRTIPVGKTAVNYRGRWEGDWQNWYMCMFCHDNDVVDDSNEWICGDEFNEWLYNGDLLECPECGEAGWSNIEWEWSKDDESVVCECLGCNHTWNIFIGFDGGYFKKESI